MPIHCVIQFENELEANLSIPRLKFKGLTVL